MPTVDLLEFESSARDERPRPTVARVLVVDDDELSSALQAHLAALLGYEPDVERDPAVAVERALEGHHDVMLLDLGMPRLDGFQALARLRSRESALDRRPLPVIAVTGYASEVDRLRCLMAGFQDHLAKPIQASALGTALARALSMSIEPIADDTAPDAPPLPDQGTDAERLRATVRRLAQVPPDERAFVPSVTESFAMRSHQLLDALRLALTHHDVTGFVRSARALRASGEFLGATRFGRMCQALEDDAAAAQWEQAARRLRALDFEHQAMLTVLFEPTRR